jgi:hypothetical protein
MLTHEIMPFEAALLGLLEPSIVAQAEADLQLYLADPLIINLIIPLLASHNVKIIRHIIIFIPRILTSCSRQALPFLPYLCDHFWDAFVRHDDQQYLASTWTLISKILRQIDPQLFNQAIRFQFQLCFHSEKPLHAIVLGCRILKADGAQTPEEIAAAINSIALFMLSNSIDMKDEFARFYFLYKAFQGHFLFLKFSNGQFHFDHFLPFFQILQTFQFNKIYDARRSIKYWQLMFEVVFRCGVIDGAPHAAAPFALQFCQFVSCVCGNTGLSLERRADPLFAFARLWQKWVNVPTARHFCLRLFPYETYLCAQTMQTDDVFTEALNTHLLEKALQIVDHAYGLQYLFIQIQSLRSKMSPACIATACVYYGDLIVNVCNNVNPITTVLVESILQEISLVVDVLNGKFDPIIASGALYLIERIPLWAPVQKTQLFGFAMGLAQYYDPNIQDKTTATLTTLAFQLTTDELLVWLAHPDVQNIPLLWGPMLVLLQRAEPLPPGFSEEMLAAVFSSFEADEPPFIRLALTGIVACLSRAPNTVAVHMGRIIFVIHRLLAAESKPGILALIHFLVDLRTNIPDFPDEIMGTFVRAVIAAVQANEFEFEMEESREISILLRFADITQIEYYVAKIPENPVGYLALLGRIAHLLPLEMYSIIIMAASAAILVSSNPNHHECIVRRFWKHCIATRAFHPDKADAVEKCASDLFAHLISVREAGLSSSCESALRLASYCIRFGHPQAHEFVRFILVGARNELNPAWQDGCQRVCADLERRCLMVRTTE